MRSKKIPGRSVCPGSGYTVYIRNKYRLYEEELLDLAVQHQQHAKRRDVFDTDFEPAVGPEGLPLPGSLGMDHLRADLLSNLEELSALRQAIAARAPELPLEYRQRLMARLEEWQVSADAQRVAQEVALMADHCAIDEELSRLESHIAQFRDSVENGMEVGRKLDFLIQEMNREINTIGSKASDGKIAQCVVSAKCVVEKLREQVQNAV